MADGGIFGRVDFATFQRLQRSEVVGHLHELCSSFEVKRAQKCIQLNKREGIVAS